MEIDIASRPGESLGRSILVRYLSVATRVMASIRRFLERASTQGQREEKQVGPACGVAWGLEGEKQYQRLISTII
ncbi:hypothetical protein HRM2_08330 [Desulforapulum autotrophicum HRM2]|uniref:Uncharacterized protein n=1 Tax=Desulforapulum autotrophicum (strain ATCC 43914 / DSM 3382 / VKM B-1955 / HRM2) TaxID=177437 RepID=C0QJU3_DESAH|nr:hypothetical protein HRM2_08330 [Desulforapulum autotrophicum HRM2]